MTKRPEYVTHRTTDNRIGVLFAWMLGIVMTAVVVMIVYGMPEQSVPVVNVAVDVPSQEAVDVHVELIQATEVPTPTPSPGPTRVPTADPAVTYCDEDTRPGGLCQVPPDAPPTPTAYPVCTAATRPMTWCHRGMVTMEELW